MIRAGDRGGGRLRVSMVSYVVRKAAGATAFSGTTASDTGAVTGSLRRR
jgi:hypothetical protein